MKRILSKATASTCTWFPVKKIIILDAYPVEGAKILSRIEFDENPKEIFINKNKLVVFENRWWPGPNLAIKVYDLADKRKPVMKRNIALSGSYVNSRMIGDYVYVIATAPVYAREPSVSAKERIKLPEIVTNGRDRIIPAEDIHYFDCPDYSYRYTLIVSLNIQNDNQEINCKTFLTGAAQNIFASQTNIYLVSTKVPDMVRYTQMLIDNLVEILPPDVSSKMGKLSKLDVTRKISELINIMEEYFNGLSDEQTMAMREKIGDLTRKAKKEMRIRKNNHSQAGHSKWKR